MANSSEYQAVFDKLNQETAKMAWRDLQTFFAAGQVVYVAKDLDLIAIATDMSLDNKNVLAPLIEQGSVAVVNDQQAAQWLANDTLLWASVVAPWLLVQPIDTEEK